MNGFKFRTPILLVVLALTATACSTQRKATKYNYLITNPGGELASTPSPAEKPEPVTKPVKGKKPAGSNKPSNTPKPSPENPAPPATVGSKEVQTVIQTAKSFVGTPYKFGGTSPQGMDCSGLVLVSYQSIHKNLPRTSSAMMTVGNAVKAEKIRPGDLVFFSANNTSKVNHVGLVTHVQGQQVRFIHATVSRGVREDELNAGYWKTRFRKAVRL
jgi:cell wall-associated NlpC family hydrolase